jgi:hypothetical protein
MEKVMSTLNQTTEKAIHRRLIEATSRRRNEMLASIREAWNQEEAIESANVEDANGQEEKASIREARNQDEAVNAEDENDQEKRLDANGRMWSQDETTETNEKMRKETKKRTEDVQTEIGDVRSQKQRRRNPEEGMQGMEDAWNCGQGEIGSENWIEQQEEFKKAFEEVPQTCGTLGREVFGRA